MNTHSIRLIIIALLLPFMAYGEDIEVALNKLADSLSAATSKSSMKKVSVLDFTDLQGNNSELGRYVAEQLSVSLANSAKDFSVLNRANLKNILAEHKLTAEGLVNPENARKLGQFSGVDAIIMGTMTPFGENLNVTTQIISTETAQVMGGATAKITRSKDIDSLLILKSATVAVPAQVMESPKNNQQQIVPTKDFDVPNGMNVFSDFSIELISFKFTSTQEILATLKVSNRSKSNSISLGLNVASNSSIQTTLIDENGTTFTLKSMTGIHSLTFSQLNSYHLLNYYLDRNDDRNLREVLIKTKSLAPEETAIVTMGFSRSGKNSGGVFRLQSEIVVAVNQKNYLPQIKLYNVLIDDIRPK